VILDELHALASSKRGDLLALDLARLRTHSPELTAIGLSATVARPLELAASLVPHKGQAAMRLAEIVVAREGAKADISILRSDAELPWAGHSARYAFPEMYEAIKAHRLSLMFVNTRSQAEMLFHELWRYNDENLPIALHHGSLDVAQRRKVEAAMVQGRLRAVVCTSTLDLGIDWGDVDLVIHVGAPKGASRLAQRIGRANHRIDEPSKALLVPANRFEVVECQAALEAAEEGAQDTPPSRPGALDVLAQHVLGTACAAPFDPDHLYREVTSTSPYQCLTREGFDKVVAFVATGGYALANYERYAKLKRTAEGEYRLAHPRTAQQYRLNVGTIVEAPMLRVRLARLKGGALKPKNVLAAGRVLGEVEEYFIEQLAPGDTFVFAGEVLRFEGLRELDASSRGRMPPSQKCRPTKVANSRSQPISPSACGSSWPNRGRGRASPTRSRTGSDCKLASRSCQARTRRWSRPFHAAIGIISSATRSRAGLRIRASACC
jgi:ATP-dependent Lhr-like helicase